MQDDLDALGLPVQVVIHGVNQTGFESGNDDVTVGRDIPWLQDTPTENVWASWAVGYRDVIILDEDNVPIAVYNLSINNLLLTAKYDELKALFTAATMD
jgi:hypothetical protein